MYIISGLTTRYWITNLGLFPGKDSFSCFQNSLDVYSSLPRIEASCQFLFHLNAPIVVIVQVLLLQLMRLHRCSISGIARRLNLAASFLFL